MNPIIRLEWLRCLLPLLLLVLLSAPASVPAATFDVVYVNGIMNTPADVELSRKRLDALLKLSKNHQDSERHTFLVRSVYNPIGYQSPLGQPVLMPGLEILRDLWRDTSEVYVLKAAEEEFWAEYGSIISPHNRQINLDNEKVSARVVNMTVSTPEMFTVYNFGLSSPFITDHGIYTTRDVRRAMADTRAALTRLFQEIRQLDKIIVVAHSQGNMLANLAYSEMVAEFGRAINERLRVVNVGNISQYAPSGLDFSEYGDRVLTALGPAGLLAPLDMARITNICRGACVFQKAAPTFNAGEIVLGEPLGHNFVEVYLSDVFITQPIVDQGVVFRGAGTFADRFEDFVYAAANSLIRKSRLTVALRGGGAGVITSSFGGVACPGACDAQYLTGTEVTLTATPSSGSKFDGWGGDCASSGSTNTIKLIVKSNADCTAAFSSSSSTMTSAITGWLYYDPNWLYTCSCQSVGSGYNSGMMPSAFFQACRGKSDCTVSVSTDLMNEMSGGGQYCTGDPCAQILDISYECTGQIEYRRFYKLIVPPNETVTASLSC